MFYWKYFYFLPYIHLTIAILHINLHYTDEPTGNDYILPHTCLYMLAPSSNQKCYETARFCLSQLASSYKIAEQQSSAKFTFHQLAKQNVRSEQLYFWSAPIDLIERYQFYLNQLSSRTGDLSSANEEYYNCTLPNFGPQCQYAFIYNVSLYRSVEESIIDYYQENFVDRLSSFTCYTHLKCNHTAAVICLDWTDICDIEVDCLDGELDEVDCWQLEVNECEENEFRCQNGQCIPRSFTSEPNYGIYCTDRSDDVFSPGGKIVGCFKQYFPSFECVDFSYDHKNQYVTRRTGTAMEMLYSNPNPSLLDDCSMAFQCRLKVKHPNSYCQEEECIKIIENSCPEIIYFPNAPVISPNIYFIYKVRNSVDWINDPISQFYICYNQSTYDLNFKDYLNKTIISNMTCMSSRSFIDPWFPSDVTRDLHERIALKLREVLHKYDFHFNYNSSICNQSNMYQCKNSVQCISVSRLIDHSPDCLYGDDEDPAAIKIIDYLPKDSFDCLDGEYIRHSLVLNGQCDCSAIEPGDCPDEHMDINFLRTNIVFQHICDGFIDLLPILIDGRNESDETECQQWQCNNIYTRCNGVLNCRNGADEAYCDQSDPMNCPSMWHQCVSLHTYELVCLSVEQMNDGIIDCFGATDERDFCAHAMQLVPAIRIEYGAFYCMNSSIPNCVSLFSFCNGYNDCENGADEKFCTNNVIQQIRSICWERPENMSNVHRFICEFQKPQRKWNVINFQLHTMIENNIKYQLDITDNTMLISSSSISQTFTLIRPRYCNNGFDIDVWLDEQNNSSTNACLCPPSYYGDRCQYQSQRVSLTIKFQALAASWRTPFAILISLIDDSDQRLIHSYEQIAYLSSTDCDYKFSKYLTYSTQPKDPNKTYAIHIDFYEKTPLLKYRGSVLLPINFPFLPVHRLSFSVDIPRIRQDQTQNCFINRCDNGKCMTYENQPHNITFCQCHSGWSGRYCHIRHTACDCSSDSLCVGISADNRSICICPINKFGRRCLLTDTVCGKDPNSTCLNGGQCVSNHHDMKFFQNFICICPKNFTGDRCEIANTQLTITFDKNVQLPQSIFFHFIEATDWYLSENFTRRATTYRSLPFRQDSITIYWSEPFHLVFTELAEKNYYLTLVQNQSNQSATIQRTVKSSDRCPNITELFNQTFLQSHLLRRIKYYHLPCQNHSLNLSCFHDEAHFCLCHDFHQQRTANCFRFDHQIELDCSGRSECQNGARCLQNKVNCPTKSWCICPSCYYGQLCQFNTNGFHSSLDGILGYHILPNVRFMNQPTIVKTSFALTLIFLVVGLIDGILSLATFKSKAVREYACGLYLLFSSVTTLLTMFLFGLKYFILLLTQMSTLSNQSFFQMQCRSLDFLLQVCLTIDQWLYACVAVERTMMTIQGIRFNKKRSVKAVKFVILILLVISVSSFVPDPIYRHVIEEEDYLDDTKRTWCIVGHSSSLRAFNYVIHVVHIIGPFLINLISVIILIKMKAQQQSTLHPGIPYKQLLLEQFQELRHVIVAPIALVTLTLPRLMTTFLSKCMHSSNDAWLYLIGYLISFIPTMFTFVIFVLPSKFYKVEFKNIVRQYRRTIQRRFYLNSYE